MPEGPEIRRAADRVAKAVVGQTLTSVRFAFPHLEPFEPVLGSSTVTAVDTHGKAMLTRFCCGLTVYSHNQLYGRWMIGSPEQPPRTRRSLRFAIVGSTRAARLYSASEIDVLETADTGADPRLARLGPDALHSSVTPRAIAERLQIPSFRNRQLAGLLLDQGFVAGLGNYLRSDILHACRVHPRRRPRELDDETVEALAGSILGLTRQSYQTGGITNEPGRVAALKKAGTKRSAYRHLAYHRDGLPCYGCGTTIERLDLGGRAVFICSRCQPEN